MAYRSGDKFRLIYLMFVSSIASVFAQGGPSSSSPLAASSLSSSSPSLSPSLPQTSFTTSNSSEADKKNAIANALLGRSLSSISASLNAAGAPFQFSTNGLSRTYYPSYVGVPVYPSSSSSSFTVPNGATVLGRSDTPSNVPYSASFPSTSELLSISGRTLNNVNSNDSQGAEPVAPGTIPLAQLGQSRSYMQGLGGYAGVLPSAGGFADPAEPDDPADNKASVLGPSRLPVAPRFSDPMSTANFASLTNGLPNRPSFGSVINPFSVPSGPSPGAAPAATNSLVGAFTGRSSSPVYDANAPPGAISYTGPASSYAEATGYGKEGYAQSSPNTAYGSVYNPKVGSSSYPSYYGATPKSYGLGGSSFPAASFFPFYLYYPVEYGYDQGEQTVMPTGWIPLIGYKRRYGYRHGPYYGYGIYIDYPPYFGFGKVKDGFGSDPEADIMAATALEQGSGASAAQSVYASRGNANSEHPSAANSGY